MQRPKMDLRSVGLGCLRLDQNLTFTYLEHRRLRLENIYCWGLSRMMNAFKNRLLLGVWRLQWLEGRMELLYLMRSHLGAMKNDVVWDAVIGLMSCHYPLVSVLVHLLFSLPLLLLPVEIGFPVPRGLKVTPGSSR